MALFSLLAACIALLIAAGAWVRDGRDTKAWLLPLPAILTGAILFYAVADAESEGRMGSLRLTLEKVRLVVPPKEGLSLGGDDVDDTVVVRGAVPQAVRLWLSPEGLEVVVAAGVTQTVRAGPKHRMQVVAPGERARFALDKPVQISFGRGARCGGLDIRNRGCTVVAMPTTDRRLELAFPRPEVKTIFVQQLRRAFHDLSPAARGALTLTIGGEGAQAATADVATLDFRTLSRSTEDLIPGRIRIGEDSDTFAVTTGTGASRLAYGATVQLGEAAQAMVRLERLDMGWSVFTLAGWLPYLALAVSVAATWRARIRSPAAFALLSLLDALLMFRLLVAMGAAYASTDPDIIESVRDALQALCAAPFIVAAFALRDDADERLTRMAQAAFGVAGVATASIGVASDGLPSAAILLLGLTALGACLVGLGSQRIARIVAGMRGRAGWTWRWPGPPQLAALAPLVILGLLRAAAVLVGLKDTFIDRPRVAITIIYLPLLFWAAARAFKSVIAGEDEVQRTTSVLAWWGALAIAFLFAILAKDAGFILVEIWPFLLLGALAASGGAFTRLRSLTLAGPLALALVAIAGMHVWALTPARDKLAAAAGADAAYASKVLGEYAKADPNMMRIQQLTSPEWMRQAGTRSAAEISQVFAHMSVYANTRFGRGFIPTETPTALYDVQLRDNVASVHIISPFGVMGAAAFLAMLLAGGLVPTMQVLGEVGGNLQRLTEPQIVGLLAVWTFCLSGVYMVLCNLQVLPFTGRNIYLLGADSVGDLAEALVLLVLSLRLLTKARE